MLAFSTLVFVSGTDVVHLISTGSCGVTAAVGGLSYTATGSLPVLTFALGKIAQGTYTVCHCPSVDGADVDSTACSSADEFSNDAGQLNVEGVPWIWEHSGSGPEMARGYSECIHLLCIRFTYHMLANSVFKLWPSAIRLLWPRLDKVTSLGALECLAGQSCSLGPWTAAQSSQRVIFISDTSGTGRSSCRSCRLCGLSRLCGVVDECARFLLVVNSVKLCCAAVSRCKNKPGVFRQSQAAAAWP